MALTIAGIEAGSLRAAKEYSAKGMPELRSPTTR